jgi:hypothetical protein
MAEEFHVDDQGRIGRLVLDPAALVHIAVRIAHNAAGTDPIVELLMRMPMHPEHGYLKECIRKFSDEGA